MKQTLLIIALFIGLGNVNAQDASNDATWEETIEFLTEYLPQFDHQMVIIYNNCNKNYDTIKHYIKNNTFFRVIHDKVNGKDNIDSLDLSLLKNVNLTSETPGFKLEATGNFVNGTFGYGHAKKNETYVLLSSFFLYEGCKQTKPDEIYNNDSAEVQRLYKAFQHLAYLAREKRKKSKF